jgi:hypothetical protein
MTAAFLRPEERPQPRTFSSFDKYTVHDTVGKGNDAVPYNMETAAYFLAPKPTARSEAVDIPFNLIRMRYRAQRA